MTWLLMLMLFIALTSGAHSECRMEPSAWALLTFHKEEIVVNQRGIQKLRDLLDTPLSVVSVIGPYRSGKLTLLNRLLFPLSPHGVFQQVGHIEEMTLYPIPSCALEDMKQSIKQSLNRSNNDHTQLTMLLNAFSSVPSNTTLVFADTPGLFAPNRPEMFDAKLLSIVNLMSTVMLYNKPSVIYKNQIEQLAETVNNALKMSLFDDPTHVIDRPHAIWCIQNVKIASLDRENQSLSGKSYLRHLFNELDVTAINNMNHFFASIDAIGIPLPSELSKDFFNVSSVEQLTPAYQTARAKLFSHIIGMLEPKKFGSSVLSGVSLAETLTQWIENINLIEHQSDRTSI